MIIESASILCTVTSRRRQGAVKQDTFLVKETRGMLPQAMMRFINVL